MKFLLFLFPILFACGLPVAKTTASLTLPSGLQANYESTKDQQGVDVIIEKIDPKTNKVIQRWRLLVEKSGTPEAAIIALAERDKLTAEVLKSLVNKIP